MAEKKKGFSRGSFPRGFSVSFTALKTGATRVIIWRRANCNGGARVKLLDTEIEKNGAIELAPPDIGGTGNRRSIKLLIQATNP